MATLADAIAARLAADTTLTAMQPTGLGFTVWSRWLKPDGPGSTPAAFDAAAGGRLKRNIVVLDGGEVLAPSRQASRLRRWDSFPTTHIFSEAHANGKQAARDAVLRIEALLAGWEAVAGAERVTTRLDNVLSLEDSPEWPGNIVMVARWRATATRVLVPA